MDPATQSFQLWRSLGELDALGRTFDLAAPKLLGLALHLTGHPADAEDLVQATFVVAMQKAASFDPSQPVTPWLAGILSGEARNRIRHDRRRRSEPLPELAAADGDPQRLAEERELVAMLRVSIDALPDEQRQVVVLRLQHGLRPAEIGEVLGLAAGTVRMRLHRGLHTLRARLPAGSTLALLAAFADRGLAQVRSEVLGAARSFAPSAATAWTIGVGAITMKKWILTAALGLLLLSGVWALLSRVGDPRAPDSGDAPTLAHAKQSTAAATPTDQPLDRQPLAATATPATGSVRVAVRGQARRASIDQEPAAGSADHLGAQDAAIAGIEVELRSCGATATVHRVRTDARGEALVAELGLGRWQAEVTAWRSGTLRSEFVVAAAAETVVELRLDAKLARGRVVDARGLPVADAEVWCGGWPTSHFDELRATAPVRLATITAADGSFACAHVPSELAISARHPRYVSTFAQPTYTWDGDLTLVLEDGPATISVHVVSADGEPIGRALVLAEGSEIDRHGANGDALCGRLPTLGREVAAGRYVLDCLAAGTHQVSVRTGGVHEQRAIDVAPGQVVELALPVRIGMAVRGRVVGNDGIPKPGVWVVAENDAGTRAPLVETAADGSFEIPAQPRRPLRLKVSRPHGKVAVEQHVAPPPRGDARCDVVLDELPPLRGALRDPHGQPLADWWISAAGDLDASEQRVRVDDAGNFVIWGLRGNSARLRAHHSGDDPPLAGGELRVALAQAAPITWTIPAALLPTAGVSGRLADEHGQPLGGGRVVLDSSSRLLKELEVATDHDGRFDLAGLRAGSYVLSVAAAGRVPSRRELELTDRRVDLGTLPLARGATLELRFLRPDASPWRERPPFPQLAAIDPNGELRTCVALSYSLASDGAVRITRLLAGRYRIAPIENKELLFAPVDVEVHPDTPRSITIPTTVGRRRELLFGGLEALPEGEALLFAARRGDDAPFWRIVGRRVGDRLHLDGEPTTTHPELARRLVAPFSVILPIGAWTLEARCGSRVTHQSAVIVGPDLDMPALIRVSPL